MELDTTYSVDSICCYPKRENFSFILNSSGFLFLRIRLTAELETCALVKMALACFETVFPTGTVSFKILIAAHNGKQCFYL